MERIEWSERSPWWIGLVWMAGAAFCLLVAGVTSPVRHTLPVLALRLALIVWDVLFFLAGVRVFIRGLCSSPAQWRRVSSWRWCR